VIHPFPKYVPNILVKSQNFQIKDRQRMQSLDAGSEKGQFPTLYEHIFIYRNNTEEIIEFILVPF